MSRFLTTLKTEQIGKWQYTLLAELYYEDDELGGIIVPAGFKTDLASIRVLHNLLFFALYAVVSGYGNYASVVHDWLYSQASLSRQQCDAVLYRALRTEGVARWRAGLFWIGVRVGGSKHFGAAR